MCALHIAGIANCAATYPLVVGVEEGAPTFRRRLQMVAEVVAAVAVIAVVGDGIADEIVVVRR